jgi:hypothetical protein
MQARILRHLTELSGSTPAELPGGGMHHVAWIDSTASKALAKPPELTWRDHAIMLLHIASTIEHALMVQYLFAAYSLGGDQVPVEHRPMVEGWRNSILAVAKEEMGHLLTVQNVLALLGGPVSLDREDYPWDSPFYPAPFRLAPLGLGTLAIYVFAEMPDSGVWEEDDDKEEIIRRATERAEALGGSSRPAVNRVGIIYQKLIGILTDHRRLPDTAFRAESVPQQASWDEWGRGYHGGPRGANVMIDVVATRDEAVEALRKIANQGESPTAPQRAFEEYGEEERPAAATRLGHRVRSEGKKAEASASGDAAAQDPSHFKRFLDIYRDFKRTAHPQGWDPAHEVAVNPTVGAQTGCAEITDVRSRHWASLFNLRYRMLLAYLTHALLLARQEEDGEPPSIRGAVMHRVFGEMYNLKTLAGILVRRPAGADGRLRAGPPFQMPYTLALPATPRNRWLMHKDLILEAGNLHRELQPLAASREGAGYLAAMADIDRQTLAWLDQLLNGGARHRRATA